MSPVAVGTQAPDFELRGVAGDGTGERTYSLGEFRGQPVVVVFYPADNSPVCTVQLRSYTQDIAAFADVGAQVVAISPQSTDAHRAFAAEHGPFAFPLLSDVDKAVGRAYGILGPVGFYRRSVFVVDRDGVVRWAHRATAGLTFRPVEEIVEQVRALD